MNTRSLTHLSDENCDKHINHSHLMYGPNINTRNIVDDSDSVTTLENILIKTHIKYVTTVKSHFLNRLYKEYLYNYVKNNTKEKRELKINGVVLIQDDKLTPCNNWRK